MAQVLGVRPSLVGRRLPEIQPVAGDLDGAIEKLMQTIDIYLGYVELRAVHKSRRASGSCVPARSSRKTTASSCLDRSSWQAALTMRARCWLSRTLINGRLASTNDRRSRNSWPRRTSSSRTKNSRTRINSTPTDREGRGAGCKAEAQLQAPAPGARRAGPPLDPEGPGFSPTTQLVFSRPVAGSPWSLTEEWDLPDNKARIEFQAVELVDPTPDQLKEYAGRYESDELAATYRLEGRDGRFRLRANSRRWEALDATVRDDFVHMQEPVRPPHHYFLRNEKGEVTGLSIDTGGRLRGVRFLKR